MIWSKKIQKKKLSINKKTKSIKKFSTKKIFDESKFSRTIIQLIMFEKYNFNLFDQTIIQTTKSELVQKITRQNYNSIKILFYLLRQIIFYQTKFNQKITGQANYSIIRIRLKIFDQKLILPKNARKTIQSKPKPSSKPHDRKIIWSTPILSKIYCAKNLFG